MIGIGLNEILLIGAAILGLAVLLFFFGLYLSNGCWGRMIGAIVIGPIAAAISLGLFNLLKAAYGVLQSSSDASICAFGSIRPDSIVQLCQTPEGPNILGASLSFVCAPFFMVLMIGVLLAGMASTRTNYIRDGFGNLWSYTVSDPEGAEPIWGCLGTLFVIVIFTFPFSVALHMANYVAVNDTSLWQDRVETLEIAIVVLYFVFASAMFYIWGALRALIALVRGGGE